MRTRSIVRTVAVAAAVAGLAACGSPDDSASTATSVVTVTRTAAAPSTVTPPTTTDPPVVTETVTSTEPPVEQGTDEQGTPDASAYAGHYQRHSSTLDLAADRTGALLEGDGAVDSENWAVTWRPTAQGISITYQRLIRQYGVGLYHHPTPGLTVTATYATGETGNRVLEVSQPAPRASTIIWCLPRTPSPECGA